MDQPLIHTTVDAIELAGLKARVRQLESIVNGGPAIAFIWDLSEGWPVAFVSESITLLGFQPAEFFDGEINYAEIIFPDDLDRVSSEVENNIKTGIINFYQRYRVITKTGNVRWVSDWTHINCDSDGSPYQAQGVILDVTDSVQTEERARRYLMASGNLFVALDAQGNITDANNKSLDVIGADREGLIGTKWIDRFVQEDQRAETWAAFDRHVAEKIWDGIGEYENEIISTKDQRYTIHWYYTVDSDLDGNFINFIAFGADVTEQRRAEAAEHDLANMLLQNPSPVLRVDKDGNVRLANPAARALIDGLANNEPDQLEWAKLITKIKIADVKKDHELRIAGKAFLFTIVPIFPDGYINLYGADVTDRVNMTAALSETLKKTIYALSSVLEARDPYTAGHEERVAEIAVKIARHMGLDEQLVNGLELAAIIHDIGKIKIPTEILSKPSRLSKAEYEIIKTHPEAGANFIRNIDFEWPIADIVEQHHERIDGSGYPKGLVGNDILLEARILGVADTLEAAASHRPYRAGLGVGSAVDIIKNGAGTHFDKDVVNACLELIEKDELHL